MEGASEKPPSSDEAGAGSTAGVEATIVRLVALADGEAPTVGNPNGLTVNRLNENGAKGLNNRGLA